MAKPLIRKIKGFGVFTLVEKAVLYIAQETLISLVMMMLLYPDSLIIQKRDLGKNCSRGIWV